MSPANQKLTGSKWVFKLNCNPDGSICKYKARFIARWFNQVERLDYSETFSPKVKPTTIRLVLYLVVTYHWHIKQLDINNGFLNGYLSEDMFMS